MRRLLVIIAFLSLAVSAKAQSDLSPIWEAQLEQWAEDGSEGDIDELSEILSYLHEFPVNLNDSSRHEELFFLTTQQINALRYYLQEYGQMLSLAELSVINGFDSLTIALIAPVAVVQKVQSREPLTLQNVLNHGDNTLLMGCSRTLEESRGYRDGIYEGDPMRLYFRYAFNYSNRIRLQLSGDKDPGEAFFDGSNRKGFDFYGGHLMLSDFGKVKRLVIGQYRLQFGQGLTLWTGFKPWSSSNGTYYRNAQQITTSSPFAEYGYLQGIAVMLKPLAHLDFTAFYSNSDRDATKADSTSAQSISYSGYHRMVTEIAKKDAINEQLVGFNLQYHNSRFRLGSTLQYLWLSKEISPSSYPYGANSFSGSSCLDYGVDAALLLRWTTLFGEVSCSNNDAWAAIVGAQMPLGSGSYFNIYYRNYSPYYQNFHSAAWGQSSSAQNEEGLGASLQYRLPYSITAFASIDHYRFPWMKYQVYAPSFGRDYRVRLTNAIDEQMSVSLQYRYRECGRNTTIGSSYVVEQTRRQRLQGRFSFQSGRFSGNTDLGLSWFSCEFHPIEQGLLLSQSLSYAFSKIPLRVDGRFSMFDISDYDAAIYSIENDLQYEYGSSVFNHQGLKFYLVARYSLSDKVVLAAKYGIIHYSDLDVVGSGYDEIAVPHRQVAKLQIRCAF